MTQGLQGQGVLGLAFEATLGTWIAPTKWIPIRSESLTEDENKIYRTNIRGIADRQPGPQGNITIQGDISFEVTRSNLLYFLYAGRFTPSRSGAGPDYVYNFVPAHVARPTTASGVTTRKTLSLLIARSDRPFGYAGVMVNSIGISFEDELMIATIGVIGKSAAQQTLSAQTWSTDENYGPIQNAIEIPAATSRTDLASFNLDIDEGGSAEHRIDGSRSPSFTRWGEREISFSAEVDFDALTDYNAFINQTKQQVIVKGSRSAVNDEVKFTLNSTIEDSFETNLSSLGDLQMASIEYHATYDTGNALSIDVATTEVIT